MGYYITPSAVIAVSTVLPTLAAIAVASRFVVQSRQAAKYGIDDWLILASLVCLISRNHPPPLVNKELKAFTVTCGVSLIVGKIQISVALKRELS